MIEDRLKLLEHPILLNDKINTLIEAFVSYYGEDRREEITQKFNSTLMLKFISLKDLEYEIKSIKDTLFVEIFDIPDDYASISEDVIDYLNQKNSTISLFDISDDAKSVIANRSDISIEEIHRLLYEGKLPKLAQFLEEYNRIKIRLTPFIEQIKREKRKEKEIDEKYYKIIVSEFKHLFSKEELDDFFTNGKKSNLMIKYFGDSLSNDGNCFDDEHEKLLNDPKTKDWVKYSIERDRTDFLREVFKLDDKRLNPLTYKEYLKNEEVLAFIKKARVDCEMISKRIKELKDEETIEIVESSEDYIRCRKEIEKRGYVDKNDPLGPYVYNSPISCFNDNYIKTENGFVLSPLILINAGCDESDCIIIHELNHLFEYSTISVSDSGCKSISGWDEVEYKFKDHREHKQSQYTGITRKYELINEYVNDRIAQEITDLMHSRGEYLFTPNRGNFTSSYINARIILEEFYIKFKEIIIKSRSNNNIGLLYEKLGEKNFEDLTELVNDFYKEFGLYGSYRDAFYDYTHGIKNKESVMIGNLIERRNIIINRMKGHYDAVSDEIIR